MVRSANLSRRRYQARPSDAQVRAAWRERRTRASLRTNNARVTLGRAFRNFSRSGRVAQARTARVIRAARASRSRSSRYVPRRR